MSHSLKVALIGANGMLASAFRRLAPDAWDIYGYDLPQFDLTDRGAVLALADMAPQLILNCAALTNVDGCESKTELATKVNGEGPGFLAELALQSQADLVHISTDFIFNGQKDSPYREDDQPDPISVYGQSKLLGEETIKTTGLKTYYIVRTSWLYGAGGNNFVETMVRLAAERETLGIVSDQIGTPTWTDDLVRAILQLLESRAYGSYHFSNDGQCSWYDFASASIALAREQAPLMVRDIKPIRTEDYPLPAPRPRYSVLCKDKIGNIAGVQVPSWQESLKRYFEQRTGKGTTDGD